MMRLLMMCVAALAATLAPVASTSSPRTSLSSNSSGEDMLWLEVHFVDKGQSADSDSNGPVLNENNRYSAPLNSREYENQSIYPSYLKEISALGFKLHAQLHWQNSVIGTLKPELYEKLMAFSFVQEVIVIQRGLDKHLLTAESLAKKSSQSYREQDYGKFYAFLNATQVPQAHQILASKNQKFGEGFKVAVIDADFSLGNQMFKHILEESKIVDEWDFVNNESLAASFHDKGDSHGASVLSILAGKAPGTYIGIIPEAKFLLYRGEVNDYESPLEELFVAAAVERAVEKGAQIISLSVGYRFDFDEASDYPNEWLDGRTRPLSLAVLGAARRNCLVIAAMGNEQNNHGPMATVVSPADADSIISVGAYNSSLTGRASFSSIGPSADQRLKPEISGPGQSVPIANTFVDSGVTDGDGTSFATPMVAGIAALTWQSQPTASAQQVRQAIMLSGTLAAKPNDSLGYGLVQSVKAMDQLSKILGMPGVFISYAWRGIYADEYTRKAISKTNRKKNSISLGEQAKDFLGRSVSTDNEQSQIYLLRKPLSP